jgi:hypothetical protein
MKASRYVAELLTLSNISKVHKKCSWIAEQIDRVDGVDFFNVPTRIRDQFRSVNLKFFLRRFSVLFESCHLGCIAATTSVNRPNDLHCACYPGASQATKTEHMVSSGSQTAS